MSLEVDSWDALNPDSNTLISGTDIDEGMLPGLINNALRRILAAVAAFRGQAYCKDKHVTIAASGGALPASPQEGDLFIEF